jgi:uncharacterized damage-inducible protein DinB
MAMTQEETLARLAQSRRALHQVTEGLSEEEMTQDQVEGEWTIKDVLGHIASWDKTCLEPLQRYANGEPFQVEVIEDYLAWNDDQAAAKRDLPLDVVLDELAITRQELIAVAASLSAKQWERQISFPWGGEGTVAQVLDGLSGHEMGHARTIAQWRGRDALSDDISGSQRQA